MPKVCLQKIRDFTVQIRRADDEIVGTGVVVSADGIVATCAHVVLGAGVNPRGGMRVPNWMQLLAASVYKQTPAQGRVTVYFPRLAAGEKRSYEAVVHAHVGEGEDDDVVLLKLVDGVPLLGPDQVAIIGSAAASELHQFISYGYRRLAQYEGGRATGQIYGSVESPRGRTLRVEPVQITSNEINKGMSGAAVLDVERNLVVGIIAEAWFAEKTDKDLDTAWAVDAQLLTLEPFRIAEGTGSVARTAGPMVRDLPDSLLTIGPTVAIDLQRAPAPIADWVGRENSLATLALHWANNDTRVFGIIGTDGEGKSSLARRWADELVSDSSRLPPAAVFWYTFETSSRTEDFFDAALTFLSGGAIDPQKLPSGTVRGQVLGSMLGPQRYLFILDGFEVAQFASGDRLGEIKSDALREFILSIAAAKHASRCLITSSQSLTDLANYASYAELSIGGLAAKDAQAFLRKLGVHGSDSQLNKVVEQSTQPLILRLLGAYVKEHFDGSIEQVDQAVIAALSNESS